MPCQKQLNDSSACRQPSLQTDPGGSCALHCARDIPGKSEEFRLQLHRWPWDERSLDSAIFPREFTLDLSNWPVDALRLSNCDAWDLELKGGDNAVTKPLLCRRSSFNSLTLSSLKLDAEVKFDTCRFASDLHTQESCFKDLELNYCWIKNLNLGVLDSGSIMILSTWFDGAVFESTKKVDCLVLRQSAGRTIRGD